MILPIPAVPRPYRVSGDYQFNPVTTFQKSLFQVAGARHLCNLHQRVTAAKDVHDSSQGNAAKNGNDGDVWLKLDQTTVLCVSR